MPRILIVEDDEPTAELIAQGLTARGFEISKVSDGREAVALATSQAFDIITLDRMLPGLDGLAVAAELRARGVQTPVLMISALSDVDERIAGLRAGGDDYLVKPFSPDEMVVRVEVLLRRTRPAEAETMLHVGSIAIDLIRHRVTRDGDPIALLPMEYKLLEFLARSPGQVISRQVLFEKVWGYYFDPGANLINVHVARLRKKLDRPGSPSPIATVKGEGYRFDAV